ncbi:hypothetical protein D3C78_1997100 [compost metagenome]
MSWLSPVVLRSCASVVFLDLVLESRFLNLPFGIDVFVLNSPYVSARQRSTFQPYNHCNAS